MFQERIQKLRKLLTKQRFSDLSKATDYEDEDCQNKVRDIETNFFPAVILHSFCFVGLNNLNEDEVNWINEVKKEIEKQSENTFSYSYWIRNSFISKLFPIPDDLDCSSYCIASLLKTGSKIDERFFLKIIKIESKPGGPYFTWFVPKDKKYKDWQDVDPSVNANLIYTCALYGIRLKNTEKYLLNCLKKGNLKSKYYPTELITLYYLSNFYYKTKEKKFFSLIKNRIEEYKYDELSYLEKILCLLSRTHLGLKVNLKNVESLEIRTVGFCYSFAKEPGKVTYSASRNVSIALILELLVSLDSKKETLIKDKEKKKSYFLLKLEKTIKNEFKFSFEISQILYLPYNLALSLKKQLSTIDLNNLKDFSLGLFYTWTGYTLLDRLIDEEEKIENSEKADKLIKKGWDYFFKFNHLPQFLKELKNAFLSSDLSFVEEKLQKDRNSYNYIEKRMKPFLICMKFFPQILGINKKLGNSLYKVYKSKMIIDQLNDEAHDWKEDMAEGKVTFVTEKLKNLKSDKEKNLYFWNVVMKDVIKICKIYYKNAEKEANVLENSFIISSLEKSYSPIKTAEESLRKAQRLIQSL